MEKTLQELQDELAAIKRELNAVCVRESVYAAEGREQEMIPWTDLSPRERDKAIEFFGYTAKEFKRVVHRTCPDCHGVGLDGSYCGRCNGTGRVRSEVKL